MKVKGSYIYLQNKRTYSEKGQRDLKEETIICEKEKYMKCYTLLKNIHGCQENHQSKKPKKENINYAKQLQ